MNGYGIGYADALRGRRNRSREMPSEEAAWYYEKGYAAALANKNR